MNKALIFILFFSLIGLRSYAQKIEPVIFQDSIVSKDDMAENKIITRERTPFQLRLGMDLSKPIRGLNNDEFSGFEFVGDLQFSKKIFIAIEVGNESKTTQSEQTNFSTNGSYIKTGLDFTISQPIEGLKNQIFLGFRFGLSSHWQKVNRYVIWNLNRFWPEQVVTHSNATVKYGSLSASWIEIIGGIKTEIFSNFFMGFSLRLNYLLSDKVPDNFDNLHIPGFNKKTDNNKFGAGFNYTLTYALPIYINKRVKINQLSKNNSSTSSHTQ